MNKLTEIKQVLSKATPGPWAIEKSYSGYMVVQQETFEVICSAKLHEKTEANHRLIANTPEYIAYLISLLEEKDKALAFYADEENNKETLETLGNLRKVSAVWVDYGTRARRAIDLNISSNNEGEK